MASPDVAQRIIASLELEPLPHEGGYFRQTWRSEAGSAILFLMTRDNFSAWHRIAQPELWHFHAGDAVEHVQLERETGRLRVTRLGAAVLAGESPQVMVPAGDWQGARLAANSPRGAAAGYALVGCTLAPAWNERGFELGRRTALLEAFPAAAEWIRALTR